MADMPPDPNLGAAGTEVRTIEALRELGHDVDAIWDDTLGRGIRHGNLHLLLELPRAYERAMLAAIQRKQYDVVHVNQPHGFRAARALHRISPRSVFIHRSHGFELNAEATLRPWRRTAPDDRTFLRQIASRAIAPFVAGHSRAIARTADGHIVYASCDSDYLREQLHVDAAKIAVIPAASPDSYIASDAPAMTPERLRRVLYVGQYAFFKAPAVTAAAINRLARKRHDLTFTWVCDRQHHDLVRSLMTPEANARLDLRGWVPQEELSESYDRSGIFLFPSFYEGFGKVFLEAMARGLCVIASDVGGMHDTIEHGVNGILCPPGDAEPFANAALALIGDPSRAAVMSAAAARTAREYTWRRVAKETADFYYARLARSREHPHSEAQPRGDPLRDDRSPAGARAARGGDPEKERQRTRPRALSASRSFVSAPREGVDDPSCTDDPHMSRQRLRVLVMTDTPPDPNLGVAGTELRTIEALRDLGHEVDAIWSDVLGRRVRHGNLHLLLELPRAFERALLEALQRKAYDVVHVNQPHGFRAARTLHRLGTRSIFIHRSHGFELSLEAALGPWREKLGSDDRNVMRRAASRVIAPLLARHSIAITRDADGHIVSSSLDADFLRERLHVEAAKIAVIPQAPPDDYIVTDPPAMTPERLRGVLHVGQFMLFKAPAVTAGAMNRLAAQQPDVRFTWVCDREHHNAVRSLFNSDAQDRLELLPWMTQDELRAVYDRSGIFLFPSFYEGFGKVFLEAMSRGLCVVAADTGGMHDTIAHGTNGVLCPPGDDETFADAALALMNDFDRAASMSVAAAQTAREHTWRRVAIETAGFYHARLQAR
jgi:glycosyltransferase involved in cell wall biosynthesis